MLPFVPVVHLARVAADTALLYDSRTPVRALMTAAVQRRCRPEELLAEYESGPRGDSYWLRRALEDVVGNAHSIAEAEAAEALRLARVPSFELNVDIVDRSGRLIARGDVVWRELRAVGEVQSRAFHFSENSWNASMARHNVLTRHSLAVAHWPPSVIRRRPDVWASGVAAWLRARASELGVPYRPGAGASPVPSEGHPPLIVS